MGFLLHLDGTLSLVLAHQTFPSLSLLHLLEAVEEVVKQGGVRAEGE